MARAKKLTTTSKAAPAAAKEYNPYLDVLKGFAILLVVFGHSIQNYFPASYYEQNIIFRIIYSFHIPLFMFLAGAAATYSHRPMNFDFIKRKFYMLVIPYIAWGITEFYISSSYHHTTLWHYMHDIILYPDYGLWFLWVLFLNFCLLAIGKKLTKYLRVYSYLLVWFAVYCIPHNTYGVGLVKWHFPFFIAGYLIFTHRERLAKYRRPVTTLCVIASPLLISTWHRLYDPHFITMLQPRLIAHGLALIPLGSILDVDSYQVINMIYIYAVPFATIGAVFWLLQLKPSRYLWKFLGFIGLYTIDIYAIVLSSSLLGYGFGSSWLRAIDSFVIATTAALIIGKFVLRPIPILSAIFLGGRSQPKAIKPDG
jgi:uncharacterized membrane protein YcfT